MLNGCHLIFRSGIQTHANIKHYTNETYSYYIPFVSYLLSPFSKTCIKIPTYIHPSYSKFYFSVCITYFLPERFFATGKANNQINGVVIHLVHREICNSSLYIRNEHANAAAFASIIHSCRPPITGNGRAYCILLTYTRESN